MVIPWVRGGGTLGQTLQRVIELVVPTKRLEG